MRVWSAWRSFVVIRRAEREQDTVAASRARWRLLRAAMGLWMSRHAQRRASAHIEREAVATRRTALLKQFLGVWLGRRAEKVGERDMERVAVAFDARSCKVGRWNAWRRALVRRKAQESAVEECRQRAERKLLRRCLVAIEAYVRRRKHWRLLKEEAVVGYRRCLAIACTRYWRERLQERSLERTAARWYNERVLKRGLFWWRYQCGERLTEKIKADKAAMLHIQMLKQRALRRLNLIFAWKQLASQHYEKALVRQTWLVWKRSQKQARLRREMAKIKPGVEYHSKKLQVHTLMLWRDMVREMKTYKTKADEADTFQRRSILRRYFATVNERLLREQTDKLLMRRADAWWRLKLMETAFRIWQTRLIEKEDELLKTLKAAEFYKESLIRTAFGGFRRNADQQAMEKENEVRADIHANRHVARRALHAWFFYVQLTRRDEAYRLTALTHRYYALLGTAWLAWRRAVRDRGRERVNERLAMEEYQRRLVQKGLQAWKIYVRNSVGFRNAVRNFVDGVRLRTLREYLGEWAGRAAAARDVRLLLEEAQIAWSEEMTAKRAMDLADCFRKRALVGSCFEHWVTLRPEWSAVHAAHHILPLVHWGSRLTRTTFKAWRAVVVSAKHLEARVAEAEGWRAEMALRHVAAAWVGAAARLREERVEGALRERVKNLSRAMRSVRKFADRWRARALASRARRIGEEGGRCTL
ncbi:spindle pole body protein Sfi1 [Irineochytrium annulatum]|nr:spindle pole body protein Sfi1 [Irineochytrium annulatum]